MWDETQPATSGEIRVGRKGDIIRCRVTIPRSFSQIDVRCMSKVVMLTKIYGDGDDDDDDGDDSSEDGQRSAVARAIRRDARSTCWYL